MHFRHAAVSASLWLSTACANLFGGQSGDDGDVIDRGGNPTAEPLPPEMDGDCLEQRELETDSPTALGKTPFELIAELAPISAPLYWVPFESSAFDVTYAPGPGESNLMLSLSLRTDGERESSNLSIIERVSPSEAPNADCGVTHVEAPIWVQVTSTDGALDERLAGTVKLYGNSIAELSATVHTTDIKGTFEFGEPIPKSESQGWKPSDLRVYAELWPGGSAGAVYPEFVATPNEPNTSPPPISNPGSRPVNGQPGIPDVWNAVAVWPRLEQCTQGAARTPSDAVLGVSAQSVLDSLQTQLLHSLTVTENKTDRDSSNLTIALAFSDLPPLLCLTIDRQTQSITFFAPVALEGTGNGNIPIVFDASLELSITAQANHQHLSNVHFSRALNETAYPLSRSAVGETLGVVLDGVEASYTQFWWAWYGELILGTVPDPGGQETHLLLTSPSAEASAINADQVANGGPGFGVRTDEDGVILPGDVILHAEAAD